MLPLLISKLLLLSDMLLICIISPVMLPSGCEFLGLLEQLTLWLAGVSCLDTVSMLESDLRSVVLLLISLLKSTDACLFVFVAAAVAAVGATTKTLGSRATDADGESTKGASTEPTDPKSPRSCVGVCVCVPWWCFG